MIDAKPSPMSGRIPTRFHAGDSLSFSVNKPAALNVTACAWVITNGAGATSFEGVGSGPGGIAVWTFDIPSSQTANLPEGPARGSLIFTLGDGGRKVGSFWSITVLPDPTKATPPTALETALAAAEATIAKLAAQRNTSLTAAGVSSTKRQLGEAIETRNQLLRAVEAERARRGLPTLGINRIKRIPARFR